MEPFIQSYGESAKTALGFFWKSGWAILFTVLGIVPESERVVSEITQFKIDYTFWMNIVFTFLAVVLAWLNKKFLQNHKMKMMEMEGGGKIKSIVVGIFILINVVGLGLFAYTQLI